MRVRREWQVITHGNGQRTRSSGFDLVRNDGNAGLWVYGIGKFGSVSLSTPLLLLMANVSPGHGWVTLILRRSFKMEFHFGRKAT